MTVFADVMVRWNSYLLACVIGAIILQVLQPARGVTAVARDDEFTRGNQRSVGALLAEAVASLARRSEFSSRVVATFVLENYDGLPQEQRYEYEFIRSGARFDVKCRHLYRDTPADQWEGIFTRYVSTADGFVEYQVELGETPTGAVFSTVVDERNGGYLGGLTLGTALDGWIGSANHTVQELMLSSGTAELTGREEIGADLCDVVTARTRFGEIRVWIAPEKDYVLKKVVFEKGPGDLYWHGGAGTLAEYWNNVDEFSGTSPRDVMGQGHELVKWSAVLDNVQIGLVDGNYVAIEGELVETYDLARGADLIQRVEYVRSEIDFHPDFEAIGAFETDLPSGTPIARWDMPDSGVRWVWMDGEPVRAHDVVDLPGFPPVQRSSVSLVVWFIVIVLAAVVLYVAVRKIRSAST